MKKLMKWLCCVLALSLIAPALAEMPADGSADVPAGEAARTILLYAIGSNLETDNGFLTGNLMQILNADIAPDIRFVVMTGGSEAWQTPAEVLEGAEAIGRDANNQIWLCSGRNGENAEDGHGKMTLLTDTPKALSSVSMAQADTLLGFVDYAAEKFPAKAYDLILWDHGGGPQYGFGVDDLHDPEQMMSVGAMARALKSSAVGRFDTINFDACLMASAEIAAALSECADYLIFSPETEPGYGQEYSAWLNALSAEPEASSLQLCHWVVDAFGAFYSDEQSPGHGLSATLTAVDCANFKSRLLPLLTELAATMNREMTRIGGNRKLNFYDELKATDFAYPYGSWGLYDLGGLLNALGVNRFEIDNTPDPQALSNAYTDLSGRLSAILSDQDGSEDDVIYFYASSGSEQPVTSKVFMVRDENGGLVNPPSLWPTGLSLFYLPTDARDTLDYMSAVAEMFAASGDEATLAMLREFSVATVRNLLICLCGQTVDRLLEDGEKTVSYRDVWDSWTEKKELNQAEIDLFKQQKNLDADITGMRASLWDEYISLLVDFLNSYGGSDAETWLALVASQQSIEAVSTGRTRAKAVDRDGDGQTDAYRISVPSPMTLIRDVSMNMEIPPFKPRDEIDQLLFGENICLAKIHGFPALEGFLGAINHNFDSLDAGLQELYGSDSTAYDLVTARDSWYELIDPQGGHHIVSVGEVDYANDTELKIPVCLALTEKDEDGEPKTRMGYLLYRDGHFIAFKDSDEREPLLPLTSPVFSGATVTMSQMVPLDFLGIIVPLFVEISEPFTLPEQPGEEWGAKLTMTKLADIADLKNGGFTEKAVITDLYGYEHAIDAVLRQADAEAAQGELLSSLEGAQVTLEGVFDPENLDYPEITVILAGKTLKEYEDYEVAYERTPDGGWEMLIYGIGDIIGWQAVPLEDA
ncbi:MAG: hypothetical protein IJH38_05035 [Clostridia bacterium]|nr:hypothetical protein [Clostridia bacterium]